MEISRRNTLLIITGLVVVFITVIILAIIHTIANDFSRQTGERIVIIDNQRSYSQGVDASTFLTIGTSTYVTLSLNIEKPEVFYHGTIRKDTFRKTQNNITFVLDIPSSKTSWLVAQSINNKGISRSDPLISCIDEGRAIYPMLHDCIETSGGGINPESPNTQFFEVLKALPLAGPSYYITYANSETKPGNYALSISFYTSSGTQDALNALSSLGYNPSDYEIIYKDESALPKEKPLNTLD